MSMISNDLNDALSLNANAQHVLAAMLCDAANIGFDGDGEGGRNMREGFSHLLRLLQQERETVVKSLFANGIRTAANEA